MSPRRGYGDMISLSGEMIKAGTLALEQPAMKRAPQTPRKGLKSSKKGK